MSKGNTGKDNVRKGRSTNYTAEGVKNQFFTIISRPSKKAVREEAVMLRRENTLERRMLGNKLTRVPKESKSEDRHKNDHNTTRRKGLTENWQ